MPNGLTPLLTKSLPPHELDDHRADVCVVMEMMVRKYDKFGWDQMNKGMRQMIREDWLDALADYPVAEVRAACRQHTIDMPNKTPNEGHIKAQIIKARAAFLAKVDRPKADTSPVERVSAERADEILREVGFAPKRFGGAA